MRIACFYIGVCLLGLSVRIAPEVLHTHARENAANENGRENCVSVSSIHFFLLRTIEAHVLRLNSAHIQIIAFQ